jgi:secretion/DNA translocation related TadE-like protein
VSGERGSVSITVAGLAVFALVLALGLADLGEVLLARSRARAAADAAALAAAQELALATGEEPAVLAADYAARNGAELTSCACAIGTFEAAVIVSVDVADLFLLPGPVSVPARARAVVDLPSAAQPSPTPSP